jgi:hypothetical protein
MRDYRAYMVREDCRGRGPNLTRTALEIRWIKNLPPLRTRC